MDNKWFWGIAAGVAALAFVTKPTRAQHEEYVQAAIGEMRSLALSKLKLGDWLTLTTVDVLKSGRFEDKLLMTTYKVSVAGHPALVCHGVFGYVGCAPAK